MTNPYPPPRRLERSSTNRVLSGVCGGIAEYLNVDPTLVRVLTAVLTVVLSGAPIVAYIVAWMLMPEARRPGPPQQHHAVQPPASAPGPWPRTRPTEDQAIWGSEGAPWEQPQPATPPPPPRPADPAPGSEPGRPSQG